MSEETLINPWTDAAKLKAQFEQTGRMQIRNFLKKEIAEGLRRDLQGLEWRLVLNENGKHLDIHPVQLEQMGLENLKLIKKAAQARAATQFQYLYENYPIFDLIEAEKDVPLSIANIFAELNSESFRKRLSDLTGLPIDFCDLQATRFRAGHFLTTHDDGVPGKNRQMAFVVNLSQRWRAGWGGCLEFTNTHGDIIDSFLPLFNSLSIFKVPQPHEVTRVRPAAKSSRISLTGWFRTR